VAIRKIAAVVASEVGEDRMVWLQAATVMLDREGRYLDADETALELLGVASVEEFRAMSPAEFAAVPPDPAEQEAWRKAYFASRAEGVLAEVAMRRTDGALVRIRSAILEEPDGRFRAMFYPIEWPTTDMSAKVYRIADVLSEWRAAERRLTDVDEDSAEGRALRAEVELLRQQYKQLSSRAMQRRPR
jgi:PAS domain-containing protein